MDKNKRYFDKDEFELRKDFKLFGEGFYVDVIWKRRYNHDNKYSLFFIIFSESELVFIPRRPSIFSFEYLPLGIARISYDSIRYIQLINSVRLEDIEFRDKIEFTEETKRKYQTGYILNIFTFDNSEIKIFLLDVNPIIREFQLHNIKFI